MKRTHMILYVEDQERSTAFYTKVLGRKPGLHVPGMTEFSLNQGSTLGLMPIASIRRLLGERLPDPAGGKGVPRSELYLIVDTPWAYHDRALAAGATELSGLMEHEWGHRAAYSLDPDGHVLAFAQEIDGIA